MPVIKIRSATIADAELIAELSRVTFYETFAVYNTKEDMEKFMNEVFSKEKLMREVGTPGNIFLLAYYEKNIVGYTRMREGEKRPEFGDKPSLEIARIYAIRASLGTGVGTALMRACLEIAEQKKKEVIWLGVWEKNDRAISFYRKWGFEKFATHDFILGNDVQIDWLMKKVIPLTGN